MGHSSIRPASILGEIRVERFTLHNGLKVIWRSQAPVFPFKPGSASAHATSSQVNRMAHPSSTSVQGDEEHG